MSDKVLQGIYVPFIPRRNTPGRLFLTRQSTACMLVTPNTKRGRAVNTLFTELRRRNIFRVAGVYAVVGWILMQVVSVMTPALNLPDWVDSFFAVALIIGFPVAMLLAWAFEMTPEGVKRAENVKDGDSITDKTGRKLDYAIISGLVLVGTLIVGSQFTAQKSAAPEITVQVEIPGTSETNQTNETDERPSIAVLAFADMSADGDQEYFSDGMAEEILNALAKIPDLRVAGRTSSFSFKGKNEDLTIIGQTLRVGHILEGSVRKQGERVRITAQLIKADDGFHLWSETYDGTLDDIFDLQEKIARAIAGELQVLLNVGEDTRLADTRTDNKQAYDLYLQGRALSRQSFGEGVMAKAVTLLESAVALDPQFADAWAALGHAYFVTPNFTTVKDQKPFNANALRSARRALAIDPSNMRAETILLNLLSRNKEFTKARAGLERLTALNGQNTGLSFSEGYSRAAMGQTKAALPYFEKSVNLDPANGVVRDIYGIALFNSGDLDGAEINFQKSLDLGYFSAFISLSNLAFMQGDSEAAIDHLLSGYDTLGQYIATQFQDRSLWEVAAKGFYSGKETDRLKLLAMVDAYVQSPDPIVDWTIMGNYLRAGDAKAFMDTFEAHPMSNPDFTFLHLWGEQETSRKVRQHPDFQGFAKRNGLLEYWQTYGWPDKCRPVKGGGPDDFTCD